MSKTIVKDFNPSAVCKIEDNQFAAISPIKGEKYLKINKIHYNIGDDCVFEITKGNKKWTIPLDKFFDKVIEIAGEQR